MKVFNRLACIFIIVTATSLFTLTTFAQVTTTSTTEVLKKANAWDFIRSDRDLKDKPLNWQEIDKLKSMEEASSEVKADGEINEDSIRNLLIGKK